MNATTPQSDSQLPVDEINRLWQHGIEPRSLWFWMPAERSKHAAPKGVALDPSSARALSSFGAERVILRYGPARRADVAQLVEQRFCKPPVPGSSPVVGSTVRPSVAGSTTRPQSSIRLPRRHMGRLSRW